MTKAQAAVRDDINNHEAIWQQMIHFAQHFEKDYGAGLMLEWLHEKGITHTRTGYQYTKTAIRQAMRGW